MDKAELLKKQQELTGQFTELQKQADGKRQEIQDIEDELKRLQGRYAQLDDLINASNVSVVDPAKTVVAKPKGVKDAK